MERDRGQEPTKVMLLCLVGVSGSRLQSGLAPPVSARWTLPGPSLDILPFKLQASTLVAPPLTVVYPPNKTT
jgi:hypothetical protein